MSGLGAARAWPVQEIWDQHIFTLDGGSIAYRGGMCCVDTTEGGVVVPGATASGLVFIGFFAEDKDGTANSNADVDVNVELARPIKITWLDNTDTGHTVAATDLCKVCYILDDHTVTMNTSGASKCGRVWGIATINGVAMAAVEVFGPAVGDS